MIGLPGCAGGAGVLGQPSDRRRHVAFGLEHEGLRVPGELAHREQLIGDEIVQGAQCRAELLGQGRWQAGDLLLERGQPLDGRTMTDRIARGEIALDGRRDVFTKLLRQFEYLKDQAIGLGQCAFGPPQRRAEGEADAEQQGGVQGSQASQAHGGWLRHQVERRRYGTLMSSM